MQKIPLTAVLLALVAWAPVARASSGVPSAPVATRPSQPKGNLVIETARKVIAFEADGTGTQVVSIACQVLGESALKEMAVLVFHYSSPAEAVEVAYVRVRKPDGTLILTPAEEVQDLTAEVSRQAPMYSDAREKHIAVKGLALGDTLEYRYVRRILKPDVPNRFWLEEVFDRQAIVREQVLEVNFPAGLAVTVVAPGQPPVDHTREGRRTLTWRHSNPEVQAPEPRPPWRGRPAGEIQVTTFPTWEALGAWYRGLAEPQARVTPAIERKAAELTRGLDSEQARLQALYEFVAGQIHYVGLSFGLGRFRPHAAEEVLGNGYGDCKDKHTLLASLLKAVGIEAWPALVRAGGDLNPDAPSPAQFDHVITVVSMHGKQLWLDTTSEVAPLGFLTMNLRGKPALVIPGSAPAHLQNAPAKGAVPNDSGYTFTGKVEADGRVSGRCRFTAQGDSELFLRQAFKHIPPERWTEFIGQAAAMPGMGFEITEVQPSPATQYRLPFRIDWDLRRQAQAEWQSRKMVLPLPVMGLGKLATMARKPTDPLFLPPLGEVRYRAELAFPPGVEPMLPAATHLVAPFGEYHADYDFKAGTLTVERRLLLRTDRVEPQERSSFNNFSQQVGDEEGRYLALLAEADKTQDPEAAQQFQAGGDALQSKNFKVAREAFQKVLQRAPKFPGAHANYGIACLALGDPATGFREMLKEEALFPDDPQTYRILGSIYASMGRNGEAIEQWKRAEEKDPGNETLLKELAHLMAQEHRLAEVTEMLERALTRTPDWAWAQMALAGAYGAGNQPAKMADAARKGVSLEGSPLNLLMAARLLVGAKVHLEEANTWAERAAADLDQASLAPDPNENTALANTDCLLQVWALLGELRLGQGRLDDARRYLAAAWSIGQSGSCGDLLAQTLERQGQKQEAARQYELAVVADGGDRDGIKRRFQKLTGRKLNYPANLGHFFKGGKALPNPSDHLLSMRMRRFPCSSELGTARAVVTCSAQGIESVHILDDAEAFQAAARAVKGMRLDLKFPDAAPRRLFLSGTVRLSAHGGFFILNLH